MKSIFNYYQSELKRVFDKNPEYPRTLQIKSNGDKTNWLSLNDESATEIVNFLQKHYNIK